MGRHKRIWVSCIILCLFAGGCVNLRKPRHQIEFYTLEYDAPQLQGLDPLPLVIRLERFGVAPAYNTNRIIYRDTSFGRNAYTYHKWRANPGDLTSYFLSRDLKQSGLFKGVFSYDSRAGASYVMEGLVDEFFEWDAPDAWHAVLSMSITLLKENEPDVAKKVVFQETYRAKEPCSRKNPQALAEAMSTALSKISGRITRDIHDVLKASGLSGVYK